ncbi:MAG: DedA family protein, partial [Paracoccus marcusii]
MIAQLIAQLTALLPVWGPWLVGAMAFLSCMMVPVPTSAVLVAAGALTGTGHLDLGLIGAGAVLGASAGDAAAFLLARRMRPSLMRRRRGAITARAQA